MKMLTGVTHAIVTIPTKADSDASRIRALVSICFGPGDDNAIGNIAYALGEDGMYWKVPHVEIFENGIAVWSPVFRGELLEKMCQMGARSLEHVKAQIGSPKWGTKYRVFGMPDKTVKVEEVK